MNNIIDKIAQAIIDVIVGAAVYFTISNFLPNVSGDIIVVVALVVTAIFGEFVEFRFKK